MAAVDDVRSAEHAFLDTGDECHLDCAEHLVRTSLREAPFAPATLLWLSLLRYDRTGADRHLDTAVDACRAGSWQDPALAAAAPAVLLRRWAREGEAADLDHAIRLAHAVGRGEPAPASSRDLPLWLAPAWRAIDLAYAYLERGRLLTADEDVLTARRILRGAVREARRPPIEALGLRHLAACEQELYLRHGTRRLLDQAIRRFQRALAMTGEHSVLRPLLLTELGTALQDRFAEDMDPGDIDSAVRLAEQALAQAASGASRPDLACHLINLGTALNTRYEQTGSPRDLDAAVRHWTAALDVLPPGSAYRPAFLERLALGLLVRWEHEGGGGEDLDAAIGYFRIAVKDGADRPDTAVYACHLADALEHRWELHRDPADLHEAVRVFTAVMSSQPGDGARAADLTCNFAHTLLARYQALGDRADLDVAISTLGRLPARGLARSQRGTVAALTARVLSMRYEASGNQDDLAAAIGAARRGLTGLDTMSTGYDSRSARLAHLLYLRYARQGRRRDLDEAIRLLHDETTGTVARRASSPDHLSQLSGYLTERYDRDGDPADRDKAILLSREARASDRRDEEPNLEAGLASALHDRFISEGWLDDLDEAIARNRRALARQVPTSSVYPVILNNLGIALHDCYRYRGGDPDLDEAIRLHERAVAMCPPGSPDRTGYLYTLAAAIQVRFERDHRTADLDRVINLSEQALAGLGPGAPERAKVLGNLAAARHLRARDTSDPADFDRAISTYRAALRRIRAESPARPGVCLGYVRALADHPGRQSPAEILHVFRQALAASERLPVVRLDVARSMGDWALRAGRWPLAAEAYRTAAEGRRTLFGTQLSQANGSTWLARGEDIAAAEAFAWACSGEPRRAATALDSGRALALSDALDARTVAGRLRAGKHDDLAARYEQALDRLARVAAPDLEPWFLAGRPASTRTALLPSASGQRYPPDHARRAGRLGQLAQCLRVGGGDHLSRLVQGRAQAERELAAPGRQAVTRRRRGIDAEDFASAGVRLEPPGQDGKQRPVPEPAMVVPAGGGGRAGGVARLRELIDHDLPGGTAAAGQPVDGTAVHVQVEAALVLGLQHLDDPVAEAGKVEMRAVLPVPRGVDGGAGEAADGPEATVRDLEAGRRQGSVAARVFHVRGLLRAGRLARGKRTEVDRERGPAGEGGVEQVDREVAAQAAIGEPEPGELQA